MHPPPGPRAQADLTSGLTTALTFGLTFAWKPLTRKDLAGEFNRTVVLTGGRIREFVELVDPPALQRVLQAEKITGIPVTWWRDARLMGEFLGRGFGRLWYAEYRS